MNNYKPIIKYLGKNYTDDLTADTSSQVKCLWHRLIQKNKRS